MKVIVDIKNKTLKMLENERSIFKGEYSADKLELYINKQLENEYPVITGLLSNGRRIGTFTTDDGYEIETIDGVEYTKAKFTLSKENGFPLSAGATQVTIWMYRTKDSVLVSKEAIGNVVFTVVDTTAFNDGDIIISGDVEGTVVNLKVEMENLQAKTEQYLPLTGGKPMTGDLKMKGNNIIFDNDNEETIEIGEEDNEYSMSIRMEDSDYYKGRYRASGFSVGNESINATLDISESKFEMSSKDGGQTSMTPDGFNVSKNGNTTFYEDGKVTRYLDNYSKYVEIELPNESGTIATIDDIPTKTSQLTNDSNYATTNQLFSKNYNDLTNKPSIPSSTSQLTNNSGFITRAVNNLTNYYLKSDTYTKDEVQQLLSTISSLKLEVVTNLPTTNISSNTIYLKPLDSAKENNIYEEYIYINSKWETIGTTAVDLTNYALKEDIPTKISELEQDVELGVSEEDVMDIIEKNAEQTTEIPIGKSETFDATSDEQIPTSKAVGDNFQPKLTAGENITIDENNVISAADTVIDLGYMGLNSTELSTVITPGLYKFNFNSSGGSYVCLLQVGTLYSLPTQTIVVYNMQILDSEGLAKDTHRLETYYRTAITSNGSTWNAWEHNVYVTKDDISSDYITYTHTGPGYSDAVHLINAFVHNRSNIGTTRLESAPPLYFKCNGYTSQEWSIISNYFNNSSATIGFTAIRNDIVQGNLTVIKAIDVPINTTITLDTITEDMYTTYTYAKSTDIPTKISQLEQDVELGGSGDSSITDLGTVNSLDDEALDVTEIGFYKFKLSKTGGAHLTACFMQVGLYYGDSTQLVLYTNEDDGKIRSAFRMKDSTTSEWSSWKYNNYMSNNYLGPINYQQNGPNKEVFLILGVTKNRDILYPNGRERGVLLYFRGNGYETTTWAVIKYYTDYSTHKFYFTAVRIDDAESLTILEAKDIPYLEELTTSSITEDMYTTYTIVTESRVNELIAAYMTANYDNGDEGSY